MIPGGITEAVIRLAPESGHGIPGKGTVLCVLWNLVL